MRTQLLLNQASDTLQETHAARRAIDGKIYSLLALASALLGLLVAFGVWPRLRPFGQVVFIAALMFYMLVIALGLLASYPRRLPIPFAGAILEFQDKVAYDDVVRLVTQGTLELVQENTKKINEKSLLLEIMVLLIVISSVMLVISVLV